MYKSPHGTSHSQVDTQNKTPGHTAAQGSVPDGKHELCPQRAPGPGCFPGTHMVSRASTATVGLATSSPPLPHLEPLIVIRAWPCSAGECDSDWNALWAAGPGWHIRTVVPTSRSTEQPHVGIPARPQANFIQKPLVSRTCRECCTDCRNQPDRGAGPARQEFIPAGRSTLQGASFDMPACSPDDSDPTVTSKVAWGLLHPWGRFQSPSRPSSRPALSSGTACQSFFSLAPRQSGVVLSIIIHNH